MPEYVFICQACYAETRIVESIHHDLPHPACPECGEAMVQSLSPPVIHGVGASGARKSWEKDRYRDSEAYRRLRKNGVQPKSVKGAAEIEQRAGVKHEVEQDRVYEDRSLANRVQRHLDDEA